MATGQGIKIFQGLQLCKHCCSSI